MYLAIRARVVAQYMNPMEITIARVAAHPGRSQKIPVTTSIAPALPTASATAEWTRARDSPPRKLTTRGNSLMNARATARRKSTGASISVSLMPNSPNSPPDIRWPRDRSSQNTTPPSTTRATST